MKCEICGRQYIALGVHLRHKHKVDPDDYREEFGILRSTPLVDDDLSAQISASAMRRLQDDDYKAEVQARCLKNAEANKGKPSAGMTRAGKAALAKRNTESNSDYLVRIAPSVLAVLKEKKTALDVRLALGTSSTVVKKVAAAAGIAYSKDTGKQERDKRAATTFRAKRAEGVARLKLYFDTSRSAAEMCRMAGVGTTTYKRWLAAGLIDRHPNGTGPRS